MTEYIKCSNCKCKFINNDEHTKFDFGYNRLGKRFKCCVKCRENGRKHNERNKTHATCDKQNNLSDIEITQRHYEQVDKDLRKLYEQEFNIDSFDRNHRLFTMEEQIDRYAKMLLLWDKNNPSMTKAEHEIDANIMAKLIYVSEMRSQTFKQILSFSEVI